MSNLRQAAQQALDALEVLDRVMQRSERTNSAINALRAALAEPEQEPVPWEQFYPDIGKPQTTHWEGCEAVHPECRAIPRKPLTMEQLREIREHQRLLEELGPVWAPMLYYFCQSIERAHGIGEQHE